MKVNPKTLLFEDLAADDIWELRDLEANIRKGTIDFEHPYIKEWMEVFLPKDTARVLIGSTVLHIRILQSINDWMWKNYGSHV